MRQSERPDRRARLPSGCRRAQSVITRAAAPPRTGMARPHRIPWRLIMATAWRVATTNHTHRGVEDGRTAFLRFSINPPPSILHPRRYSPSSPRTTRTNPTTPTTATFTTRSTRVNAKALSFDAKPNLLRSRLLPATSLFRRTKNAIAAIAMSHKPTRICRRALITTTSPVRPRGSRGREGRTAQEAVAHTWVQPARSSGAAALRPLGGRSQSGLRTSRHPVTL